MNDNSDFLPLRDRTKNRDIAEILYLHPNRHQMPRTPLGRALDSIAQARDALDVGGGGGRRRLRGVGRRQPARWRATRAPLLSPGPPERQSRDGGAECFRSAAF